MTEEQDGSWRSSLRALDTARAALIASHRVEEFRAVASYCRSSLIWVADAVYDLQAHGSFERHSSSVSDALSKLERFFTTVFHGSDYDDYRAVVRKTLGVTSKAVHSSSMDERKAATCIELTTCVVHVVGLAAGRRRPTHVAFDRAHRELNDTVSYLKSKLQGEEFRVHCFKSMVEGLVDRCEHFLAGRMTVDQFRPWVALFKQAAVDENCDFALSVSFPVVGGDADPFA